MKTSLAILALALALGGCNRADDDSRSVLSQVTEKVQTEVREELATQALTLNSDNDTLPRAELTPQGDLLIDGEKVAMDAAQRALALQYRTELAGVAEAGAAIGMQAADLATQAMTEAASSVFDGDSASVEERIKGQADEVRASAALLCDRLPALIAAQDALAAAVPQFAPYADADHDDIDECGKDVAEEAEGDPA